LDVALAGVCLSGGRAAFFGVAVFGVDLRGTAFAGALAVLFGFLEGIYGLRLLMKERGIIPAPGDLYRLST
jgi:hypothetical protein